MQTRPQNARCAGGGVQDHQERVGRTRRRRVQVSRPVHLRAGREQVSLPLCQAGDLADVGTGSVDPQKTLPIAPGYQARSLPLMSKHCGDRASSCILKIPEEFFLHPPLEWQSQWQGLSILFGLQ